MKKSLIFTAVAIGSFLGASVLSAMAWTGATATPPNGNVSSPINVGGLFQEKTGNFQTDGNLGVAGLSYLMGNVGIGTVTPKSNLWIAGDLTVDDPSNPNMPTWDRGGIHIGMPFANPAGAPRLVGRG